MSIAIAPEQSMRALALLCATPATDLRTSDVRIDVRTGDVAPMAVQTAWAKRVRVFAPTTGMGHVGFAAGYARGSQTWSPPI